MISLLDYIYANLLLTSMILHSAILWVLRCCLHNPLIILDPKKQLVDLNGIMTLSFYCLRIDLWQFVQAMTYDWHVIVDGSKIVTMKYKDEAEYKSYRDECYDKCRLSQDQWKCLYCQKICKSKNRLNCHRKEGCKKAVDANGKPLKLMLYPHGGLMAPLYYE